MRPLKFLGKITRKVGLEDFIFTGLTGDKKTDKIYFERLSKSVAEKGLDAEMTNIYEEL